MSETNSTLALFFYIPFCRTICTYCDFNVYAHLGRLFDVYVDALTREVQTIAREIPPPRRAHSLALGGGTPSVLPTALLAKILESAHAHFEIIDGAEISLEANPGTLDADKLRGLRQLGINRLSLGVQTFDDARLRAFNRDHNAAESREAFGLARRAGFDNINLDLLFGLPDQSLSDWEETLERALAWQPEHLSLYGLQVEEGTALARQIARGRVNELDTDLAAEMFTLADEKLGAAGFLHYEISNYARPGFRSRHNSTYWRNEPYLGFGAGAHSYLNGTRYENVRAPAEYITRSTRGESVIAAREEISRETEIAETLMLGLRLAEGISYSSFEARLGLDVRAIFGDTLEELQTWGLIQSNSERMWLTLRGRLLSNQVLWRFFPDEERLKVER